eukprot:COSAG01_NODE_33153_length_569_cov_0.957447_1_plen_67_part_10
MSLSVSPTLPLTLPFVHLARPFCVPDARVAWLVAVDLAGRGRSRLRRPRGVGEGVVIHSTDGPSEQM